MEGDEDWATMIHRGDEGAWLAKGPVTKHVHIPKPDELELKRRDPGHLHSGAATLSIGDDPVVQLLRWPLCRLAARAATTCPPPRCHVTDVSGELSDEGKVPALSDSPQL